MASQLSFSISHIPDDVLLDIFSVCSPRTLAACTQVSHKFLSLASSFLYRSVEIKTRNQLFALFKRAKTFKVFWKKVGSVPRSLEPFLSLDQIRSFHLLDSSSKLTGCPIPRTRFPPYIRPRLAIEELVVESSRFGSRKCDGTSLFGALHPSHLVLLQDWSSYMSQGPEVIQDLVGKVEQLTIVGQTGIESWRYFRIDGRGGQNRLRYVLRGRHFDIKRRSTWDDREGEKVRALLRIIAPKFRREGFLSFEGFRDVEGAVVVEVAGEEELALVESGMKDLSEKERGVLRVQVRGSRWWEEK